MIYGQVHWQPGRIFYVSQLPARPGTARARRDGVDWGYTSTFEGKERWEGEKLTVLDRAIPLSPSWQRRFLKHLRDCNLVGQLVELD
jgi:hypothetical protein